MATEENDRSLASLVNVAICLDHEVMLRLRPVVRHLCVGLVDHGAKVRVITESDEAFTLSSFGPVQLFVHKPLKWLFRRSRFRRICEFLSESPPTVVYAIGSASHHLGGWLANAFDSDLIVQLTSFADLVVLDSPSTESPSHIVAASDRLLNALHVRSGAVTDHSSLIRPGVLRGSDQSCFDRPDRTPCMVCTTALEDSCRIDVLLGALREVLDAGVEALLFLVGTGNAEASLRAQARSLDLSRHVTFGRPSAQPIDILRGSDILMIPPGDSAISARPLQAMANGTVVVGFDGSAADYLHDGRTAVVCKEATTSALAASIELLLKNPTQARELASNARAYVKEHHPMSAMAQKTAELFRQLVMRRHPIPMTG